MSETLVLALTPLVIFCVTWIVSKLTAWIPANIRGIVIIAVVGILSAVLPLIVTTSEGWFLQTLLGLVAVFVNELIKQLKKLPANSNG